MANTFSELSGDVYVDVHFPAVAENTATGYFAMAVNPFDGNGYIDAIEFLPIANITGDNTNTFNLNVDLSSGTEIANLDLITNTNAVVGTRNSFTITGTDAQRTLAKGAAVSIEREDIGVGTATPEGCIVRFTFLKK